MRKVNEGSLLHHVIVLPIKSHENNQFNVLINVAELITEDQCSLNIEFFLRLIISKYSQKFKEDKLAHAFVTDKSFANINALVKSQNNMTIQKYLELCYTICNDENTQYEMPTLILLCSSHLSKNWKKDINRFFSNYKKEELKLLFLLVGELMNIKIYESLVEYISLLIELFSKKCSYLNYKHILERLRASVNYENDFDFDVDDTNDENSDHEADQFNSAVKTLYGNSPFYKYFHQVYENIQQESESTVKNENFYYCPEFLEFLLKNSIAILPFWSAVLPSLDLINENDYIRPNNGYIIIIYYYYYYYFIQLI